MPYNPQFRVSNTAQLRGVPSRESVYESQSPLSQNFVDEASDGKSSKRTTTLYPTRRAQEIDRMTMVVAESQIMEVGVRSAYLNLPMNAFSSATRHPEPLDFSQRSIFDSLCLAETASGNPVRYKTPNFKPGPQSLRIGQSRFLNLASPAEENCVLTIRKNNHPSFHLEVTHLLLERSRGRAMYNVLAIIDVTNLVREVAEVYVPSSDVQTLASSSSLDLPDVDLDRTGVMRDEIWSSKTNKNERRTPTVEMTPKLYAFLQGISRLRLLFNNYFVIAPFLSSQTTSRASDLFSFKSRTYNLHYSITLVSPVLFRQKQDLRANFSHCSWLALESLRKSLDMGIAHKGIVKWGELGVEKWLYCVPVDDGRSGTRKQKLWICYLVDLEHSQLW